MTEAIDYEESGGNVFEDLKVRDSEEALLKAELAMRIAELIESKGLGQAEAARVLGVRQPHVSRLVRGQLRGFSMRRLLRFLLALDQDVELVIKPKSRNHSSDQIRVHLLK